LDSAEEADTWWSQILGSTQIINDLEDQPMAGPVAFISFPFSAEGSYEIIVPKILIGSRKGQAWITSWNGASWDPQILPNKPVPARARRCTSPVAQDQWLAQVREAITRIHDSHLAKVVLAREEILEMAPGFDRRWVMKHLGETYPQTWTFCVKDLIGASPELLIRQDRGLITSRVLAGTIHGDKDATALAEALSSSSKDLAEHEYAVASVAQALDAHCTSLHVPEIPFVLQLPNVMHLASDITGAVRPGSTVVALASAIHPSAAVCGTPTDQARELIAELEDMDRGRYAGPIGWINSHGDGEIALALRCGLITNEHVHIYAGCGILADSDPMAEWEETNAKLQPMKQALGAA
jgi:menaquinone-specific isochorismate synthase